MSYLDKSSNTTYSLKINYDWILYLAVLFRFLSPITSDLSFVMLSGYVFLGRQQIIKGLIISWVIINMNFVLGYEPAYASILKYFVIFCAFSSIMLRYNFKETNHIIIYTFSFSIFLLMHSIYLSSIPLVSILKVITWSIVASTLLMTWSSMSAHQYNQIQQWMLKFSKIFILTSLFIYIFSDAGYSDSSRGFTRQSSGNFQGILKHPQDFGITIALFSVPWLGQIFIKKKLSLEIFIFLFLSIVLIIFSKTRTAFFGIIMIAIIGIPMASLFYKKNISPHIGSVKNKRYLSFILILVSLIVIDKFTVNIFDDIKNKRQNLEKTEKKIIEGDLIEGTSLLTKYINSRGVLLKPALENVDKYPFSGIGFGVGSDPKNMDIFYDPFFGLPVGAPTEKGVIFIMILEEIGFFGFLIFLLWTFYSIVCSIKKNITSFLIILMIYALNMGEAILFSPGGPGLIFIIYFTLAVTKPKLT